MRCHRIVVAAQSEFLAELMGDDGDEVTIIVPEVDAIVVQAAYHYSMFQSAVV